MANGAKFNVDMTEFNRSFAMYMRLTSKSFKDAVNNKLFDIARFAYRDTEKANKSDIKSELSKLSNKYPARTLAEMIVITRAQNTGQEVKNLADEADKLIRLRAGHAGFTRSGWIRSMKEIAPSLGKSSINVSQVPTALGQGGGNPVRTESSTMVGSVWNDVAGKSNATLVENIKENGAQSALDKVTADMNNYIDRKLEEIRKKSGF